MDTTGLRIFETRHHQSGDTFRFIDSVDKIPRWMSIYRRLADGYQTGAIGLTFSVFTDTGKYVCGFTNDVDKRATHEKFDRAFALAACIEANTTVYHDGRFVVFYGQSGRDCDCSQYTHGPYPLFPPTRYAFERTEDEMYEWADGPCSMYVIPLDQLPDFREESRDLALEAFEDGHPHVVSTVRFETH